MTIPIVALSPWKQTHPNAFVRMSVIGADEISKDATILRVLTDELIPNVDMLASFMYYNKRAIASQDFSFFFVRLATIMKSRNKKSRSIQTIHVPIYV